jgi:hypothetical protein
LVGRPSSNAGARTARPSPRPQPTSLYPWEDPEIPSLDKEEPTSDLDDLDEEELDPINHPEDPDYDQAKLWDNVNDADYYDDIRELPSTKRRYKALYYEDI